MNISKKRSLTSGPNDNETNSRDIAIRIVVWHEWVVRTAPPNLEACLCVLINNHTKTNKRKNNLIFFSSRIDISKSQKFGFKVKVCFVRFEEKKRFYVTVRIRTIVRRTMFTASIAFQRVPKCCAMPWTLTCCADI